MSEELRLIFLGGLRLTQGEKDLTNQVSAKAQALFCYLSITKKTHTRQAIAGLFWPEKPEDDARRSLRVDLAKMPDALKSHLIITRSQLTFDQDSRYTIDVESFEQFLRLPPELDSATERNRLREAVDLYKGEFLDGVDIWDAPEFETWMIRQRERFNRMVVHSLDRLVDIYIEERSYVKGIEYVNRLLRLSRWREKAHRQLMWLLARSGQRGAALTQYDTCVEILAEEFGVEPSEETEQLYLQIREMDSQSQLTRPLPPLTVESDIPFQAPAMMPYFVGRESELSDLAKLLKQHVVCCLVGMGGVGKTALAVHLAHQLRERFTDGVLWANAATGDPALIAEKWAAAYGYDFSGLPDIDSQMRALRGLLADKEVLLVLDDVTSAARIRPLIPMQGNHSVVLTTRNSELARVLGTYVINVTELEPENGRQLLTSIIGQERAAEEAVAVTQVCELLHNLPLAVTIAGQRLASRPRRKLADFVERLGDEKNRLDLKRRDVEVRASFAISWESLDETQRQLFALLAVFQGRAFTAATLAAVANTDPYPAQDRLDSLVTLSLLNEEGERYYRQHPLLADFAQEHLGHEVMPYQRMIDYYLDYATHNRQDYALLQPEWENLTASIKEAYRLRLWRTVIQFTAVLKEAWFTRTRYTEARQAYAWAREAALSLEDEQALAETLFHWGRAAIEQSDHTEARALLNESLAVYEGLADQAGIADVKSHLARIAMEYSHYDEAEQLLTETRRMREELEDQVGIADAIYRQARFLHQRGDFVAARHFGEEALARQELVDDQLGMVRTLRLISNAILQSDEMAYDLAEAYCQRALSLSQVLQDRGELGATLFALSGVHRAQGRLALARQDVEDSLALFKNMGDQRSRAVGLFTLSRINRDMQEYETAVTVGYESLALCQALQDRLGTAYVLQLLGDLMQVQGKLAEAYELWLQAQTIAQQLQHTLLIESLKVRLDGEERSVN